MPRFCFPLFVVYSICILQGPMDVKAMIAIINSTTSNTTTVESYPMTDEISALQTQQEQQPYQNEFQYTPLNTITNSLLLDVVVSSSNPSSSSSSSSSSLHNRSTYCSSYTDCTECINSSNVCHWCDDQKCHAKGSFYGCTMGASCDNNHSASHNDTCNSHKTCTDCTLSSTLCHWCAFDDQCHAIGSIYGCAYGVNCYSNDRCQRLQPEYVYERWYHGIGIFPIFLILGSVSMILFCSTVLYVVTGTLVHGLYQLLSTNTTTATTEMDSINRNTTTRKHNRISSKSNQSNMTSILSSKSTIEEAIPFLDAMEVEVEEDEPHTEVESPSSLSQRRPIVTNPSIQPNHHHHHHLQFFLKTCRFWYTTTIFLTLSSLFFVLYFFPKAPDFNVCSDQVAWKSIIDGITSLKFEASFEILISIYNPNHLSLGIDGVNGKLNHDGDEIGTFIVPSSTIHAASITDILVLCTVVPDKWEALGLISEYYKGTLVFDITAGGIVRIPSIGFNIPVKITDFLVPVNDLPSDRHLCACPQWKDVKTIKPLLINATSFTEIEYSPSLF